MKHLYVTQQYDRADALNSTAGPAPLDHYKYMVTKVVNSLSPTIGAVLMPQDMDYYMADAMWKVTVT